MKNSTLESSYLKLLGEKRDRLKMLYPMGGNNKWILEAKKGDISVYSMSDERTGLKIIRAQGKIKAPRQKIVEVSEEITPILEWDDTIEEVRPLHRSKEYYIVHAVIKKVPLATQRESVLIGKFFHDDGDVVYGAATSIDHHEVEKSTEKIRATAYLVGWILKPSPENNEHTDFTMIMHVNPEGWVPKSAFNWFAYTQAFNLKPFGDYVEKRYKKERPKL